MIKKLIVGTLLVIATLVAVLFIWGKLNVIFRMREGDAIVQKVEQFRHDNGRLPTSLREMGLPESEEGPLHYEKRDDMYYAILFSSGFDDLWGYYSDSKKWENHYR